MRRKQENLRIEMKFRTLLWSYLAMQRKKNLNTGSHLQTLYIRQMNRVNSRCDFYVINIVRILLLLLLFLIFFKPSSCVIIIIIIIIIIITIIIIIIYIKHPKHF